MICFVYQPKRKGQVFRLWYGTYRFDDMPRPKTVALGTMDKRVALKRLQDIINTKQRQAEGLEVADTVREAYRATWGDLVENYGADLLAKGVTASHVKRTTRRLLYLAQEAGWKSLRDVSAASFIRWRSGQADRGPKTVREYQASANAFLGWLVRSERMERNPLAHLEMPSKRAQVRPSRAYTPDELRRLLAAAPRRRVQYLLLAYTGMRYNEARGLRFCDVRLDDVTGPHVLVRAEEAKDRETRAVPLHPRLAEELRAYIGPLTGRRRLRETQRIFEKCFPLHGTLLADLARARIPHEDETGRVVHFHSFRKTFQTLGVRAGIGLRSAQEILGHSTPDLTANVYTDVAGLELHREVAKLPWLGDSAPPPPVSPFVSAVQTA